MTDKIEVTQADGETAASIRAALIKACPGIPSYPTGIVEPFLAAHRTRNDAQVQGLVEAAKDYMSRFGHVLKTHRIYHGKGLVEADAKLRAALAAWEGQQ